FRARDDGARIQVQQPQRQGVVWLWRVRPVLAAAAIRSRCSVSRLPSTSTWRRSSGASAAERVAVLSQSRALNDAYQLIKRPVPRAEYLLAHAGVTIGDNERLDPAFLMEILELREELAEARAAGNTALVGKLQAAMQARRNDALGALSPLFAAGDLAAVKDRLILLRYVNRYLEECDAALDED